MADEARGRGVSVTIKHGKGYDETWVGFTGLLEEVRTDIATWFGIDSASVTGQTGHELSVTGTTIAHNINNVRRTLGGTPATDAEKAAGESKPAVDGEDPWSVARDGKSPGPVTPAENPLLAQIAGCKDVEALKRLYAENKAAMAGDVFEAWKARGKELSAK